MASDSSGPGAKKEIDEIGHPIERMLTIADKLSSIPAQEAVKTTSRSQTLPAQPQSETTALEKQKSEDLGGTNQGESETAIPKLQRNLRLLKDDARKLEELNKEVANEVRRQIGPLENLFNQVKKASKTMKLTEGNKNDLETINRKIFNLMCQVPLLPNKRQKNKGLDSEDGNGDNNEKPIVCLPAIHAKEEDLKKLAVFKAVQKEFMALGVKEKIFLLSFAAFPENQEVNRTMLMYWWIGEGLLKYKATPPEKELPDKERPENVVKEILKDFTEKKLIEPVENKRKVKPNSYKMTPFVHSSVVQISKEMKLFDIYHEGKKPTMKKSDLHRVCLVEGSSSQPQAKASKMPDVVHIETVFNVSERFPDFTFKWFSEDQSSSSSSSSSKKKKKFGPLSKTTYKALKVFYLGRWERTAKRHIEVENPELMKYLKHMTQLKLLSFQGISRIERLDDAVCKLRKLIILDLRACYNLEKLPDKIDSLKALTYLDITDCYMIDRMPKRLSWLDKLEVLKGFVVSDATDEETVCTLAELEHLKHLRKLSISINKGVTVEKLFEDIGKIDSLEKLKVAWGGINDHTKEESHSGEKNIFRTITRTLTLRESPDPKKDTKKDMSTEPIKLPPKLKKLDLQCFPDADLPSWLQPNQLGYLKKLYIKGGTKLAGFGTLPSEKTKCKVKILRLKFLPRLKVEWRDLKDLYFPELKFLDKYQCPQVSFCPTDGIGIWRKKDQVEATLN